jgi:hypothetical protein
MGHEMNEAERCYLFSTIINYLIAPYYADAGVLAYGRLAYSQKKQKNSIARETQFSYVRAERPASAISRATGQCSAHIN